MLKHIKPFYQIEYNNGKRIVKNLSIPINLNLIITKNCNADCVHCCANANEKKESLSLENIKKFVNIAKKNKIFYFVITGGEPLIYKNIWNLLKIVNNQFGIILNTNGTLIDEDIASKLSKYNIANIHVSLDAPNQKIYKKQRGKKTKLEDVLNGIKNLVKYNVKTTTKLIITNINKNHLEETLKLSISLGIKNMIFSWFKAVGRGLENERKLSLKKREIIKITKQIYKLKEKYKDVIKISFDDSQNFPFLIKKMNKIKYRKLCGDYFCRIDYNGDVFPCPFLEIKVGNIFEEELKNLWNKKELLKLRYFSWGNNLLGICKKCKYKMICSGGCRARSIMLYNHIAYKDPLCWMGK